MTSILRVAGAAALLAASAMGQSALPGKAAPLPARAAEWFPPSQMTTVGVYYYPEAWPESQWARDIANIRKFGFEFVHMGEFAWYFMEPEEGKFQFDWLEKNVKLAADQGLKVILCTPTPAPPAWLVRKHPEVLMIDAKGRRMNHGSRQHADWSSPVYRQYVERIITELAKRFGKNPAVWGWQLDNELSHYGSMSYTPAATSKFRLWLSEKYGTIDRLNRDWGNAFWSQMYNSFDQIDMPNAAEHVQLPNPHAMLDLQRWFAADAADYIKLQTDTLRKHTVNQWITTNFMAMFKDINPLLSTRDLDVFTWTHYPAHGNLNEGPLGFRLGSPYVLGFMHDMMRQVNGLSGLMELQPGQVNWGQVNPWPQPGAIRMWIWHAFGGGAQIVCTYRYRQPLSGNELYHKGIVEPDGVTLSPGGAEFSQASQEIIALRKHYKAAATVPASLAARRTGFLLNWDARWDMDNHKQTVRWDTAEHWLKYYRALKSMMAPVDVVTEDRDLSGYPFLIAPAYQLLDRNMVRMLTSYAEAGGHLILTTRTGQKDRRGHLWESKWAEPIYDLIGASIPIYDLLPAPHQGKVRFDGKEYTWGSWGDVLEPKAGTTVLATYGDHFYAGKAAAITRKLGKGSVSYIGVDTFDGELERAVLNRIYTNAGVSPRSLTPGFIVDWRDGFWLATNFTDQKQTIPAGPNARLLVGSRELAPAGVTVWTE